MSDHSETSSINGEWEQMSEPYQELMIKMERMEADVKKLKIDIEKKDQDAEKKNKEIISVREDNEAKEKEIGMLKSKLKNMPTFSLQEWMKVQMENMKLSSRTLSEKTMEVYKKIWEKEMAKAQATSSSHRKQVAEEVQKMEELCEEISKGVLSYNEDCVKQLTNLLTRKERSPKKETRNVENRDMTIDSFLGEFTAGKDEKTVLLLLGTERVPMRTIIIRKAKEEGYFEVYRKCDNGDEAATNMWIPDNVERDGFRYKIEKNALIRANEHHRLSYTLTDEGLIFNGNCLYRRV